jgi:hypothetical protein
MIPYFAQILDVAMNNSTVLADWKRAIVFSGHKGGNRSLDAIYRQVSLTSVVCKQAKHVIESYLRHVWNRNDWLYESQHGFRPGYSCEIK